MSMKGKVVVLIGKMYPTPCDLSDPAIKSWKLVSHKEEDTLLRG